MKIEESSSEVARLCNGCNTWIPERDLIGVRIGPQEERTWWCPDCLVDAYGHPLTDMQTAQKVALWLHRTHPVEGDPFYDR